MQPQSLRVELTDEERRASEFNHITAYSFERTPIGSVAITEHWSSVDGGWTDEITLEIPPRVWAIGLAFITGKTRMP